MRSRYKGGDLSSGDQRSFPEGRGGGGVEGIPCRGFTTCQVWRGRTVVHHQGAAGQNAGSGGKERSSAGRREGWNPLCSSGPSAAVLGPHLGSTLESPSSSGPIPSDFVEVEPRCLVLLQVLQVTLTWNPR